MLEVQVFMDKGMAIIHVLSQMSFDDIMKRNNITDDNVEQQNNTAFISVICTNNCNDSYMVEKHGAGTKHWFNREHPNVLNVQFDDLEKDIVLENGIVYKTITPEQADEIVEFIDNNTGKNFLIHCYAGISRSAAIALFLSDFYGWVDKEAFESIYKNRIRPNQKVYHELKMALHRFDGIEDYEDIWKTEN